MYQCYIFTYPLSMYVHTIIHVTAGPRWEEGKEVCRREGPVRQEATISRGGG